MFEKEAEEYIKVNKLEWELECHRTSPIGEVVQAFQNGAEFGFAHGLKAKINTTTISDAPLENEKRLTEAKEIIKEYICLSLQEDKDIDANVKLFQKAETFLKECE